MADTWKEAATVQAFQKIRGGIPLAGEQAQVLLDLVGAMGSGPRRILDIGCGDGVTGEVLLRRFPEAAGDFVDYSPAMLQKARERLKPYNARLLEGDLNTPLQQVVGDVTYDCIVSSFAIHHLSHERKQSLYREVFTLLNPGGVFVNMEHVASPSSRIEALSEQNFIRHIHAYRREQGEQVTLEEVAAAFHARADQADNILAPVGEQCRWLQEIGFEEVDCFFKYYELAVFGGFKP